MRGFVLVDQSDEELYTVSPEEMEFLALEGNIDFPTITKAEIEDRGKANWFAKSLVLIQTGWFIVQCIARASQHLPLAELEVVTLAYAILNLLVYILWWCKPQNVQFPVRVKLLKPLPEISTRETIPSVGFKVDPLWPFNITAATSESIVTTAMAGNIIMGVVTSIFGAIHCIAWSYEFPSYKEEVLWRVSSVFMTAGPVTYALLCLLLLLVYALWIRRGFTFIEIAGSLGTFKPNWKGVAVTIILVIPLYSLLFSFSWLMIGYVFGRITSLILALIELRALPAGAFQTVSWTTFIPHIG